MFLVEKMKTEFRLILVMSILVSATLFLIYQNPDETPKSLVFEKYSNELVQINEQSKKYLDDVPKFNESKDLMQEKIKDIATDSLGIDIAMSDIHNSYFPIKKGSQIDITGTKESFQICDVVENIPIHLQEIRKSRMFQMFAKKYSAYPIELFLQDERMHNSEFHYGLIATSGNEKSALTYFHANSCTNEITDLDDYFLSCHYREDVFGTKNKDDIVASLNLD